MEKKCLVLMPEIETDGYAQGHFGRVYEYVIAPACRSAGFVPQRVQNGSSTPLDAIKLMVDSDVVVCDFSTGNQHVSYGFAIRRALNLPVVLIKDTKTQTIPAVENADPLDYDDSLRIDTVQNEVSALTDAIRNADANKPDAYPLLGQLKDEPKPAVAAETAKQEKTMPIISPLPGYVGKPFTEGEIEKLKVGDSLFHLTRGRGEITSLRKSGHEKLAGIKFESGSAMLVLLANEYFRKIDE